MGVLPNGKYCIGRKNDVESLRMRKGRDDIFDDSEESESMEMLLKSDTSQVVRMGRIQEEDMSEEGLRCEI